MLVVRAIKLAHKKFHNENLDLIRNILVKNDYPSGFIEKYFKKRMFMMMNVWNSCKEFQSVGFESF